MNLNKIIPAILILSIIIVLTGAFMKIQHFEGASIFLIVGLLSQAVLAFLCLLELANAKEITKLELLVWSIGFILLTIPISFIYVLIVRKRIILKM
jgi:hypothetical protein